MKKIFFSFVILLCTYTIVYSQIDCNDQAACNYDAQATGISECLYAGDPCSSVTGTSGVYDDKCACILSGALPFDFSLVDPCNCSNPNNIDLDQDGQVDLIYETIVFMGPSGQDWSLSSGNGLLDMTGNALASLTTTETQSGVFEISFYHVPGTGYFSSWSNGSNTQVVMNSCASCTAVAAIPTMSEWGLIVLALLTLNFLVLFSLSSKLSVANIGGGNSLMLFDWKDLSTYPFDSKAFKQAINIVGVLLICIAAYALLVYGYFTSTDVIGLAIASPIFTYLLHLVIGGQNID